MKKTRKLQFSFSFHMASILNPCLILRGFTISDHHHHCHKHSFTIQTNIISIPTLLQAVSIIKSLGGNVKMLVTNPKEEEEKKAEAEGDNDDDDDDNGNDDDDNDDDNNDNDDDDDNGDDKVEPNNDFQPSAPPALQPRRESCSQVFLL